MTTFVSVPVIRTSKDLRDAIKRLDAIIDAEDGSPEADERTALSDLVAAYEQRHHPVASGGPVGLLRSLMTNHGLSQTHLPEIGAQSVVSAVLLGKRAINARMAVALGKRFRVNPAAFLAS